MTTEAKSTGPRTEAGKAISSRNSTKHGLFAKRDFIREGEDEEYAQTFTDLMAELSPGSVLEQTFATEIMGANWRLRRCGILEFDLARDTDRAPDAQDAIQKSIDRARAQSHNILRRSLAELRKLQTERHARILQMPDVQVPIDLGVTDTRQAVKSAARSILAASSFCKPPASATAANPASSSFCSPAEAATAAEDNSFCKPAETATAADVSSFCKPPAPATAANPASSSFCNPAETATPAEDSSFCKPAESALAEIEAQLRREAKQREAFLEGSSFCKPPAATPRNAPCPCGSGAKYKRCCGKNAPPVLNMGA
jgi:hypothetical protein